MLTTSLAIHDLGKRFNREWLFDGLSVNLSNSETVAITGHNGSGKSTLLKIISGLQLPSKGTVSLTINSKPIPTEEYYRYLSFASPYIELIEEYTLLEMLEFYFHLKPLNIGLTVQELPALLLLDNARSKEIRSFSSGMKQRLKLGLALFCNTPIMILDEPTSHLDEQGKAWFYKHLKEQIGKKMIFIASNQEEETQYCTSSINIPSFLNSTTHRS
jgi:ABC-type multidrug transport system ATPase subunit